MYRSQMSPQERALRSRLAKLVHEEPLLHGTLTLRHVSCGNPRCRCAHGKPHPALYLTFRADGRTHQVFVPASLAAQARQWVANDRTVRGLLDALSHVSVERLKKLKGKRKTGCSGD